VSTEDGRIILYDIKKLSASASSTSQKQQYESCEAIAQIGGVASGFIGRIKDFEILTVASGGGPAESPLLFVTGSSDGAVRVWKFSSSELETRTEIDGDSTQVALGAGKTSQVGTLLGTHESGHRITCLAAFVMDGPTDEGLDDHDEEMANAEDNDDESGSDSD